MKKKRKEKGKEEGRLRARELHLVHSVVAKTDDPHDVGPATFEVGSIPMHLKDQHEGEGEEEGEKREVSMRVFVRWELAHSRLTASDVRY